MSRKQHPNNRFNGLHFSDPWKEWVKGYKRRDETTKDATKLSNEIYNYRHELFPIRSIPIETHPGYVTHSQNFFRIKTRNIKLSEYLTTYFADENRYRDEGISYGNAHDLGGFFEFVFQGILVDGVSYYAIEWGEVKLGKKKYILPIELLYANPATIEINKSSGVISQKFSFIAKLMNDYYKYQDNEFQLDELIVFKHPTLFPSSPINESIKYLKDLRQWMTFSLWQGKANAEPTNYALKVSISRYGHSDDFARKESIARVKVKRIFRQPIGDQRVGVTTFYEALAFADYKKQLNVMRDYFVGEFNKQLMNIVQIKNNIKFPITLEYRGFTDNSKIDEALNNYQSGKKNVDEFVESIKDDYNKKLF